MINSNLFLIKLYSFVFRLLLKVNFDSDGFLEQHKNAGLLTPHLQSLYNHAVAGSGIHS